MSKKDLGISSMRYVENTHSMIEAKALEEKNIYQYKIKNIKEQSFLMFYREQNLVEKFKIIDINYSGFFEMILIRIKD